jgi:hypothetical protein
LTRCNSIDTAVIENKKTLPADTVKENEDSVIKYKIDTTTLKGRREYILNRFMYDDPIRYADFDTLIDLTYDGNKDYIIGYYGQSGTGIKNRIQVFIYDKGVDNYLLDSTLTDIANPTFYVKQKKITGFYIGGGGGGGRKLEWKKDKWVVTKSFTVDNDNGKGLWIIKYPLKHKIDTINRAFQMIPPDDIMETGLVE